LSIERKVLGEIVPSQRDYRVIDEKVKWISDRIYESAKKIGIKLEVILGGSYAKATFIKNSGDIDLFVAFHKCHWKDELSDLLRKVLDEAGLKYYPFHASRTYYKVVFSDLIFELVPVRKISTYKDAVNSTDLSQLHVEWLLRHYKSLTPAHILLSKKFFKAIRCYGAENYINGFSGHVLDLLIVKYGSFVNLLRNLETFDGFLQDPINPKRNAAAALSPEKRIRAINYSKLFLEKPSISFFKEKKLTLKGFIKENPGKYYLKIIFYPLDRSIVVAGAKMYRAYRFITKKLLFVKSSEFYWKPNNPFIARNPAYGYFLLEKIPRFIEIKGPPMRLKRDVERFIKRHKNTFIRDKRIYSKERYRLGDIIYSPEVFSWVRGIEFQVYSPKKTKNL